MRNLIFFLIITPLLLFACKNTNNELIEKSLEVSIQVQEQKNEILYLKYHAYILNDESFGIKFNEELSKLKVQINNTCNFISKLEDEDIEKNIDSLRKSIHNARNECRSIRALSYEPNKPILEEIKQQFNLLEYKRFKNIESSIFIKSYINILRSIEGRILDLITSDLNNELMAGYYQEPHVSIIPSRSYFYKGLANPVHIKSFGIPEKDLTLEVEGSGVRLKKYSEFSYMLYLEDTKPFYIRCIANINGTKKEVCKSRFKGYSLPIDHVAVGFKENGEVSKEFLINIGKINAAIWNMDINHHYHISGFNLSTIDEKGNYIENYSTSAKFTEEQIDQLKQLKSGDKVYFENILAETYDGFARNLGTMVFKIK